MSKGKIFVRERRKVGEGEKKPRYNMVGVAGVDLKIYVKHIRKMELEQIAEAIGADVVVLQAGKDEEDLDDDE
ncbi:MAG: hypothetical protein GX964_04095 [Syntrophomonadaceae bacterium]|jgi:hypothetical protein|nr:hypothetical protein [Syntrophomonadaceae bacterium]